MSRIQSVRCILLFTLMHLCSLLSTTTAAEESAAETLSLFNGKNLDGWYADVPNADEKPDIKPSFIVREGKL